MVKPEWGTKRACLSCGAKFYDLRREPIICPKCETKFEPVVVRPRRGRAAAVKPPPPPPPVAVVEPEAAADDDDDDTLLPADDDDDVADDPVEDAAVLDGDDAKIVGVPVATDGEEEAT